MARTSSTRAKCAPDPDPDPDDLEDLDEDLEDRARTDYGSNDGSLFPDKEEDEDQGHGYDEAADEAETPFNRDDDPEYRKREKALRM